MIKGMQPMPAGLTMQLTLTPEQMEQLAAMVAAQIPPRPIDRYAAMVERLGEACTKETARSVLNVSATTLYRMMSSGKIRTCCNGERVDVRSIAEYIEGGK